MADHIDAFHRWEDVNMQLTSTQPPRLAHLYHASSRQMALVDHAQEQLLAMTDLLAWEHRLVEPSITISLRHREGVSMIRPGTGERVYLSSASGRGLQSISMV